MKNSDAIIEMSNRNKEFFSEEVINSKVNDAVSRLLPDEIDKEVLWIRKLERKKSDGANQNKKTKLSKQDRAEAIQSLKKRFKENDMRNCYFDFARAHGTKDSELNCNL